MAVEKISSPPYIKVGEIDAWAPVELKLNPRLLLKTKARRISKRTRINARLNKNKCSNYSLTSSKGQTIFFILMLEELNHATI
jgi:hypothetical protein